MSRVRYALRLVMFLKYIQFYNFSHGDEQFQLQHHPLLMKYTTLLLDVTVIHSVQNNNLDCFPLTQSVFMTSVVVRLSHFEHKLNQIIILKKSRRLKVQSFLKYNWSQFYTKSQLTVGNKTINSYFKCDQVAKFALI